MGNGEVAEANHSGYGGHYHTKSYMNKNQKVTFNSMGSSDYLDVMYDVPFVNI